MFKNKIKNIVAAAAIVASATAGFAAPIQAPNYYNAGTEANPVWKPIPEDGVSCLPAENVCTAYFESEPDAGTPIPSNASEGQAVPN